MADISEAQCACEYCKAKRDLFRSIKTFADTEMQEDERRVFLTVGTDCLESSPIDYGYEDHLVAVRTLEGSTDKTVRFLQRLLDQQSVRSMKPSLQHATIVVGVLLFFHLRAMVEHLLQRRPSVENVQIFQQIIAGNDQHMALLQKLRVSAVQNLCLVDDIQQLTSHDFYQRNFDLSSFY